MNKRKERVIQKAYELFQANGYHATSIQEIIHHSEISKGSFYNYFASKGELLKAVFSSVFKKLEEEREAQLIGEDPSDIHVFAKQVIISLELNKESKSSLILEDALVSNEPELTDFIRKINFKFIKWVHDRFQDIFAEDKKPYLLDCAILFTGIMHTLLRFNKTIKANAGYTKLIEYAVQSVQSILDDVSARGDQIFSPEDIHKLSPDSDEDDFFNSQFSLATLNFRKIIDKNLANDQLQASTCLKFVHFIQEELFVSKEPRVFLIESALLSLEMCPQISSTSEFENYRRIVTKLL